MTKEQLREILTLSSDIRRRHSKKNELFDDPLMLSGDIISFNKQTSELLNITKGLELTDEDKNQLNFFLYGDDKSKSIVDLEDYSKQLLQFCHDYEKSLTPIVVYSIYNQDIKVFNNLIKKYPYITSESYWSASKYNELMGNSQFRKLNNQMRQLEEFETVSMTLGEFDEEIFSNDYFFDRINKALVERIFNKYSKKFEEANTQEEKQEIKLMLDKKIEEASEKVMMYREKSLNLNSEKTTGGKYEI